MAKKIGGASSHHPAYPTVLREGLFSRIFGGGFYLLIGLALTAAGGLFVLNLVVGWPLRHGHFPPWLGIAGIAMAFGGVWFLYIFYEMALVSLVLTAEALERRSLFGSRVVPRAEIAGYHLRYRYRLPDRLIVEPKDSNQKPLTANSVDSDRLRSWFGDLPDLDLLDAEADEEKLMQDPRLGSTREARARALRQLRSFTTIWAVVGLGVCFWAAIFPHPWRLVYAIGALAPVGAFLLAAASRNVVKISALGREGRRLSGAGFFIPSIGVALRILISNPIVSGDIVFPTLAIAAVCAATLLMNDRRLWTLGYGAMIITFSAAWALCLITAGDVLLDRSTGTAVNALVDRKYIESHSRGGDSHDVTLAPWGPMKFGQTIDNRTLYDVVDEGGSICMRTHAGAFGFPWYEVDSLRACDPLAPRPRNEGDPSEIGR
jgi:hypothetical protein